MCTVKQAHNILYVLYLGTAILILNNMQPVHLLPKIRRPRLAELVFGTNLS